MQDEQRIPDIPKFYLKNSQSEGTLFQQYNPGDENGGFQVTKTNPRNHYKCLHCNFETVYLFSMKRHTRMHSGDFLFCGLCSRYFYDANALATHMKAHSGELLCKFCGKQFISFNGLNVHQKRHCKSKHKMQYEECQTIAPKE